MAVGPDATYFFNLATMRAKSALHLGAWHCRSSAQRPYRPHLPHPEAYQFVGCGEVEIVGGPQDPPDGERVVAAECISIEEANRRVFKIGRSDLAALYRLAALVRER